MKVSKLKEMKTEKTKQFRFSEINSMVEDRGMKALSDSEIEKYLFEFKKYLKERQANSKTDISKKKFLTEMNDLYNYLSSESFSSFNFGVDYKASVSLRVLGTEAMRMIYPLFVDEVERSDELIIPNNLVPEKSKSKLKQEDVSVFMKLLYDYGFFHVDKKQDISMLLAYSTGFSHSTLQNGFSEKKFKTLFEKVKENKRLEKFLLEILLKLQSKS